MSGVVAPEPSGRVGPLSAGLGRQVPSHAAIREAGTLGPARSAADRQTPPPHPHPRSSPTSTAGDNASAVRFRETRGNAEKRACRETLQLLPFSCRESLFINS